MTSAHLSRIALNPKHRATARALHSRNRVHALVYRLFRDGADPDSSRTSRAVREARPLFRLELDPAPSILIQSKTEPIWDELCLPAAAVVSAETKTFDVEAFVREGAYRFRLEARPAKRSRESGRRRALRNDSEAVDWLCDRFERNGCKLLAVRADALTWPFETEADPLDDLTKTSAMGAWRFDGELRVLDPALAKVAVTNGLGPQKAYGFGLLSLGKP